MMVGNQGDGRSPLRGSDQRPFGVEPASAVSSIAATPNAAVYIASRATVPERSALWRRLRDGGIAVTSSWIDEAGEGETACFTELWDRIRDEIAAADFLVMYAETEDFPLKGALIEAGIAIGMGKPVTVCLPGVDVHGRTHRPVGSWIEHRLVNRNDDIFSALASAAGARSAETAQPVQSVGRQSGGEAATPTPQSGSGAA